MLDLGGMVHVVGFLSFPIFFSISFIILFLLPASSLCLLRCFCAGVMFLSLSGGFAYLFIVLMVAFSCSFHFIFPSS